MNPYSSSTNDDGLASADASQKTAKRTIVAIAASIGFTCLLLASLSLFLNQPNHRLGGVAWNALFQFFGPFLALLSSAKLLSLGFTGRTHRVSSLAAVVLLGAAACYCLYRSFPIMLSV